MIVGCDGQLKLTDFGISRAGASEITQTGTVLGTAQYVSPEQAEGDAVSTAADLYSVGVILYELLTGRVPFEGQTVVAILLQHVKERPTAPSARHPAVPPELDAIVMRALEHAKAASHFQPMVTASRKRTGLLRRARLQSISSIRRRSLNPDPVGARPC